MRMKKLLLLAVTCLLHGLAVGDVLVTTRGQADGTTWFRSTGIFVADVRRLVFEVKASRDAVIGLATSDSDESLEWEVAIGGANNQINLLKSLGGRRSAHETRCDSQQPLDPNAYRSFWISWDEARIRLGTGTAVGANEHCNHVGYTPFPLDHRRGIYHRKDLFVRLGSWGGLNTVNWIVHGHTEVGETSVITTDHAGGSWFHPTRIFVAGPHYLVFEAKASRDALIGLTTSDNDESLQWEVAIGGGNNQRDFLRSMTGTCEGRTVRQCDRESLNPNTFRQFWISWDERNIRLGTGTAVGENEYCSHEGSFKLTDLYVRLGSYGVLNTVNWIVHATDQHTNTPTTGGSVPCDGGSCHSNAYCKRTRDGNNVCKCNLGYTGDGQNCETVPASITPDQQGKIQMGFDAASIVADLVASDDSKKFSTGLKNFASAASTFAPAVSLVFGAVFTFIPMGDDALTLEMRESFREVNRKLDQMQDSIEDLSDKADWNVYKTEFLRYMNVIESCAEKVDELAQLTAGEPGFDSKKTDVIDEYRLNLGLGRRFKNFLTIDFLGENIFSAFVRFVDNDRTRVQTLMKIVMQLLMKASKIEMANIALADDSPEEIQGRIDDETENWCGYFEAVQNKLTQVDDAVRDAWNGQARYHDIPDFARDNSALQHSDFAQQLLDLLAQKYYWRVWFVASYDEIGTYRKHIAGGAWGWFRNNGRNLVVASATEEATFDQNAAQNALNSYKSSDHHHACCSDCSWFQCWSCCSQDCEHVDGNHAQAVYNELPWHGTTKFVVQKDNGLQAVSSLASRLARVDDVDRCGEEFSVLYFG